MKNWAVAVPAAFAVAALAGCGAGARNSPGAGPRSDPASSGSGAVATVAGREISKAAFDHRLEIEAHVRGAAVVPMPPDYAQCIARRRQSAAATVSAARRSCAQEYRQLSEAALDTLIAEAWVGQQASSDGIEVSANQVRRHVQRAVGSLFKTKGRLSEFLAKNGETYQDLLDSTRAELTALALREHVTRGAADVTGRAVAAYYAAHQEEFSTPERLPRRIRIVIHRILRFPARLARLAICGQRVDQDRSPFGCIRAVWEAPISSAR